MTAFDNIKVNNWPATSNDLEDFLVLKLPLNDNASLTESLPVVVGSKVLHPKKTLTNTGVFLQNAGPNYSDNSTGGTFYNNGSWSQAFDGALNTGPFLYSTTTNTLTLPAGVTWSSKIRVHALRYSGEFEINGTDILASHTIGTSAAWYDLTATLGSSGTLSTIMIGATNTNYVKLFAVELDDTILVNPPGGPKKHYDNNAKWGASSVNYISTDALKGVSVNQPWTCEFYWKKEGTQHGNHGHFLLNPNNQSLGYREAAATGTSTNDFYCDIGGSTAVGMITTAISENVWNHFAFVHEGGGTIKTYLNGQLETTKTIGTTGTFADSTSIGGGVGSYTSQGVKGSIQDYRIYLTAKYTSNFTPPGAILS